MNAANYLFWLSQLKPSIHETHENRNIGPANYSTIDLKRVTFSYPLRPQARVLHGVNLAVSTMLCGFCNFDETDKRG